jgi:serine/threonine protein kinase
LDPVKYFAQNKESLKYDDFEVIKKLGEGNFTEIYKVTHVKFPNQFFALKVCSMQRVSSMRRETDIMLEKHSLNKVYASYNGKQKQMPAVQLL